MKASESAQRRSALSIALAGFFAIGVVTMLIVLGTTLRPSESTRAKVPEVSLPRLENGAFAYVSDPASLDNAPTTLLIVRMMDGSLKVWRIPTRNGFPKLPDVHWGQEGPTCERLAVDFKAGVISCRDASLGQWGREPYVWNLDGKNISPGRKVDDLIRVDGMEKGDRYVMAKL